ncbi:hypothetical protein RND71_010401 [Anisodus tanguticus]|uniref:Uncharacterized protein n=1 Tax=Anisodus tanguticus TaxID=243964 RepID=A0AAE1SLK3_9SOLA|nr:hypothetical protein RND71_010401 [Anisodus tanguticus]
MMIYELVVGLFCTVQVELEQLLSRDASFDHHMRWLRQGLVCLSTFLLNLSTPSFQDQNLQSLLSRIESFSSEAGIVVSSFYDEDTRKTTEVEYRLAILPFQVKFNHVNIECTLVKLHEATMMASLNNSIGYVGEDLIFLKTSLMDPFEQCKEQNKMTDHMLKSSEISSSGNQKMDEVVLGFLECILDDLRKLLHDGAKLISTLSNELKKLIQGVILLLTFLADPTIQYIKCKKRDDLLIEIEYITLEVKSAICSLYEDASVSRITEVDDVLFCLQVKLNQVKVESGLIEQLKYEVIKAVIGLICPDISASSTTDNPLTNLLNFLPCNFEVIDSYFNMVKSSTRSSSGILEMDEVFMGFHKYILDNLLLKDGVSLAFTDTNKVKSFYHGLLVLVIFLIDPPIQYIECKKQNHLLADIGTLAIEAEAAISLTFEDALDNRKK